METSPTTYEELLEQLQILRTTQDSCQWGIGDGAALLLGEHLLSKQGEVNLTTLANDLGVGVRSLQDWHKVASFYPKEAREEFENLTYTHYRLARRYAGDLEHAMELLEHACIEDLSVAKFERHLKEAVGKPLPKPDDVIRLPRVLAERVLKMLTGELALEPETIKQYEEYLNG